MWSSIYQRNASAETVYSLIKHAYYGHVANNGNFYSEDRSDRREVDIQTVFSHTCMRRRDRLNIYID